MKFTGQSLATGVMEGVKIHFEIGLVLILEFLNDLYHQDKAFNSLKGYLSALLLSRAFV